jgi:hypothetical protein
MRSYWLTGLLASVVVLSLAAIEHGAFGQDIGSTKRLRVFDNPTIAPEFGPGGGGSGSPPPVPPVRSGPRAISEIKVADNECGIYNGSNQSLEFWLSEIRDPITLKGHQLRTFALSGATATVQVETQGVGMTQTALQAGKVYVIEPYRGYWVVSEF